MPVAVYRTAAEALPTPTLCVAAHLAAVPWAAAILPRPIVRVGDPLGVVTRLLREVEGNADGVQHALTRRRMQDTPLGRRLPGPRRGEDVPAYVERMTTEVLLHVCLDWITEARPGGPLQRAAIRTGVNRLLAMRLREDSLGAMIAREDGPDALHLVWMPTAAERRMLPAPAHLRGRLAVVMPAQDEPPGGRDAWASAVAVSSTMRLYQSERGGRDA